MITRVAAITKGRMPYKGIKSNLSDYVFDWFDVETGGFVMKEVSTKSKQLLVNEEIPQESYERFLDFEKECERKTIEEAQKARLLMDKIYHGKTEDVAIYYTGGYSIIENGDGQRPLMSVSRRAVEKLNEQGYLMDNRLLSFKGRRIHPYRPVPGRSIRF